MTEQEKISKALTIAIGLFDLAELNNHFTQAVPMRGNLSSNSNVETFDKANIIIKEHFVTQRLGNSIHEHADELLILLSELDMDMTKIS